MEIITKEKAINIADEHIRNDKREYCVHDNLPTNGFGIYNQPTEDCWYVTCSFDTRGTVGLGSSRLIFVSKKTGKVLYDGSANDEG